MQMTPEKGGAAIAAGAMSSREFNRTPTNVVLAAVDQLRKDYPELFAVLPSEEDWATKLASWSRLNIPTSHSGAAVSDTFVAQYYLETGLLALLGNGSLTLVITTPESEDDVAKLRTSIVAYRRVLFNEQPAASVAEPDQTDQPVQTEPSGPTEAELDAAIINDWRTLCTADVRSRCRDAAYKQRLDRLMAEGKI
jgi:hypothetical protein